MAESVVYLYRSIREHKRRGVMLRVGIAAMTVYAVCNMVYILIGYGSNYEIYQRNHYELINVGKEYKNGGTAEKIVLHKLKNDTFAQMMPYQEGYGYIEVWMKKYYELPVGMVLEWE